MANPQILVEFVAETAKLVSATKDVEKQGEKTSGALGKINVRSVAKWTAVAGAAVATTKFLKSSADSTVELAKATGKLQRATNLDAETASAWVEVLKLRGISVDQFQTSLTKTSKLMDKSRLAQEKLAATTKMYNEAAAQLQPVIDKGGEAGKNATKELRKWDAILQKAQTTADKANEPFARLGVNLEDVRKGNTQKVLLQVADGLQKVQNPATRTALAVQLFGRQGLTLLPILLKGSKAIQEQLKHVQKYGATIGEKTVKNVGKLVEKQRDLKLIQDGLKNSIGQALLPAQVSLYGSLLKLLNVFVPLTRNVTVMKVVLIAAAVAMGAYKLVVISTALAENKFVVALVKKTAAFIADTASTIAATVATWAMNASLLAVVVTTGLIVVGIAALIAAGILLYKNWDKVKAAAGAVWGAIKKAAQATLDWLKRNWPYIVGILVGPFGLAVAAIYKNWDKISGAFSAGFAAVKRAISAGKAAVIGWGSDVANWIKAGIVGALSGIGSAAWNVVNNVGAVISQFYGRIKGWGEIIGNGIKAGFSASISGLVGIFKGAINAVLRAWNALKIPGFKINLPKPLHDIKFPGIPLPDIPLLAQGGIVTGPTLAMVGERGPEAVLPLGSNGAPIEVRVFIGDQELRGMVKTEVRSSNQRTAQVLLAGRLG